VQSKKQSAAKPPDETVFFIDRSLGIEPLRTELINAGLTVKIHDDHFARDAEDPVWLRAVGEQGWVLLTKDQRLRYRPLEIAALRASNARVFVLTAGNLRGVEIAAVFQVALPRIDLQDSTFPPGTACCQRFAARKRHDQVALETWKIVVASGVLKESLLPDSALWRPFGVQIIWTQVFCFQ
jgi:predicted nuclease of predicted toxin-antitoxin system